MKTDNSNQIGFSFVAEIDLQKEMEWQRESIDENKKSWDICWDWIGPKPDGVINLNHTLVNRLGTGKTGIHYCARCILEKEIWPGVWIIRIGYVRNDAGDSDWCLGFNGEKYVVDESDIWPPVNDINNYESATDKTSPLRKEKK